jgi:GxxExxY protein
MMTFDVSTDVIGCAIDVHKALGPCHQISTYVEALKVEFMDRSISFDTDVLSTMMYKGVSITGGKLDFVIGGEVGVVVVDQHDMELYAWMRTALRALDLRFGLMISFRDRTLTKGVRRVEAVA